MAVCVTGMHRSGTSMATKLLKLGGLYLGRDTDMLAANPSNPEGHWEHERIVEINEELLAEYGGGWDYPPNFSAPADGRRLAALAERARTELAHFAGREPWGWKDPRTSLTLPFWRPLVGPMSIVICVRNPLEVALSLRYRNGSTVAFGLALWFDYNDALIRGTTPTERTITHYGRYHADPVLELRRVADAIGLKLSDEQAGDVRQSTKRELRHSRFGFDDLLSAGIAPKVLDLYDVLCQEAGALEEGRQGDAAGTIVSGAAATVGFFDYGVTEQLQRRG